MVFFKNPRRIHITIMALFMFSACNASAEDDKAKHFGLSAIFGAGIETYLHYNVELDSISRIAVSTTLGSFPGLIKEIIDSTQPDNAFSTDDMVANISGAFVGAVLSSFFNNAIQVTMKYEKDNYISVLTTYKF